MLSIGRVAAGGGRYYADQVAAGAEDYYLGSGEAPGYWIGAGVAGVGLVEGGRVDEQAFMDLLDGVHPVSGARLAAAGERRVSGFDLTFSAPKSVSLLWALSAEQEIRGLVADAHRAAIADAVGYLEADALRARRGHNGINPVAVDGMVAAAFGHRTSRAGDPQLHTHVVVANLVRDGHLRWSAPDSRAVYRHARTAGFIYQSSLRARLTRSLGVEWGPVRNGHGDLAGVERPTLELFSSRRADIESVLSERGLTTANAARIATLDTRPAKADQESGQGLFQRWQNIAAERGVALDGLIGPGRAPQLPAGIEWRICGPGGVTAQASSFDRRDLLRGLAEAHPDGATRHELEAAATRIIGREGVVELTPAGVDGPQRRWTTVELLAAEAELVRCAEQAGERGEGVARPDAIADALAERPVLSDEQADLIRGVCESRAGIVCVIGKAGTGKTFALDAARAAWNNSGVPVVGASLSARAAAELQAGSAIPSGTLAGLLGDLGRPESRPRPGSVVVVDEAGMVGTRQLHQLVRAAGLHHWKLVLVGDFRQLPEIDAGGSFARLTSRCPTWTLTHNRRQAQRWERDALDQLRDGQPQTAVAAYHTHGRITIAPTAPQLIDAMIADWQAARADGRSVAMLAVRRYQVDQLNHGAQAARIARGELDPNTAVELAGTQVMVGDQVICTRNDRRAGIINGQQITITNLDPHQPHIHGVDGDGRPVNVGWDYARAGRLQLGYALTVHKAQGATYDVALLAGDDRLFNEAGYVGLSRGRLTNRLYIVNQPDLTPRRPVDWARRDIDRLVAALGVSAAQAVSTADQGPDRQLDHWSLKELVRDQDRLLQAIHADQPPDPTRWLIGLEETRRLAADAPLWGPAHEAARHQLQTDTAQVAWAVNQRHQWQTNHRRDGEQLARITATIDARRDAIHQSNLASPSNDLLEVLGPPPDNPIDRQSWATAADRISLWAEVTGYQPRQLGQLAGPRDYPERAFWTHARSELDRHLNRGLDHGLGL